MWYFVKQRSFNGQKREIMWLLDSIISYTFVALWYWLAVQELANMRYKLKGRGRVDISTVFNMDQLGKIRQHHWK